MADENIRVLLIDDNADDRETVFRQIHRVYCVLEATTGREGLDAAQRSKPACVLLDYRLPDFDGLELLQRLVADQIPVVMLTGQGSEEIAARAIKLGAEDYLSKAMLTKEALTHAINNAIEKFNLRKHLINQQRDITDFVAFASDEMKAPLRAIADAVESIAGPATSDRAPANTKPLQSITSGVAELNALIDAMVQFTRVQRKSDWDLESVDLEVCVDRTREMLKPELADAKVSVGRLPMVRGDEDALTEVFRYAFRHNLRNAGAGAPSIRVYSQLEDEQWAICVTNDADAGESSIDRNRPCDSRESYQSGLDLLTCATIIKQLGGRMWMHSMSPNTCVGFTLPKVESRAHST